MYVKKYYFMLIILYNDRYIRMCRVAIKLPKQTFNCNGRNTKYVRKILSPICNERCK